MLAVITCHYNFSGYSAPRANLMRFLRHMELCRVPVYGAEVYAPGQQPFTRELPGWTQLAITQSGYLWQKENLLNIAEQQVPSQYDAIAWLDADVSFTDWTWPLQLRKALDSYHVVQPFHRCHWTDREGRVDNSRESVFSAGLTREWKGQPGFAMAARRDFFRQCGGLFELCPTGNGDTVFAAAVLQPDPIAWLSEVPGCNGVGDNPVSIARCADWSARVAQWVGTSYTHLHGIDLYHDWHGDRKNRIYLERCNWVRGMNTRRELTHTSNGTLTWTPQANPERVQAIKGLFDHRREDG